MIVRRALVALVKDGTCYPEGSLFDDCGVVSLRELVDTERPIRLARQSGVADATTVSEHLKADATFVSWDPLGPI